VQDVEVGAADPGGGHPHQHLAGVGFFDVDLFELGARRDIAYDDGGGVTSAQC